jgi:hypothetical protein
LTNDEITHAVLTPGENKSLLALRSRAHRANKAGRPHIAVTEDQLQSMQNAFLAILAAGNAVPERAMQEAKALGWI